jgi:hypothetical protein
MRPGMLSEAKEVCKCRRGGFCVTAATAAIAAAIAGACSPPLTVSAPPLARFTYLRHERAWRPSTHWSCRSLSGDLRTEQPTVSAYDVCCTIAARNRVTTQVQMESIVSTLLLVADHIVRHRSSAKQKQTRSDQALPTSCWATCKHAHR